MANPAGQSAADAGENLKRGLRAAFEALVTPRELREYMGFSGLCRACNNPIRIQIFRGEVWCSDDCRKKVQKEG